MREIYCSQRRQRLQLLKYDSGRVTIRARGLKNVVGGRNHRAGFQAARDLRSNLALSDLTGKPVILAFYPADWSLVCGDQVTLYNEILPVFRKCDAELLDISVDGVWSTRPLPGPSPAFSAARRFRAHGRGRKKLPRVRGGPRLRRSPLWKTATMPALRAGASRDQPGAPIINQVQLCFRGRMRFVFRHFPMTEVHPHSEIAAESAEFAGSAGLFWDMHDALFENQSRLSTTTIFLIAQELGLC